MYLSGDMDFLLATPVPIRAVFIAKLFQAVLPNFALFSLFGIPILFGLGISNGYNVSYYPLVILIMIFLAMAASGLSSLLVMLVVRVLPPRRAAEILGFMGAMFGLLCSQLGNLANSFGRDFNISGTRLAGILYLSNIRWLPLNGRSGAGGTGRRTVALGQPAPGSDTGLCHRRIFVRPGHSRTLVLLRLGQDAGCRSKKDDPSLREQTRLNGIGLELPAFLPRPVLAIVQKDFLTLRSDLRNLSQLVSPVIFGALYTLFLLRGNSEPPGGRGTAPGWFMESFRTVLAYGNIGISLFVGWMLLSRLAGMGFSHEGRNYWMLKVSLVRVWHLLASKFIVAYIPALSLGLILLTIISIVQRLPCLCLFMGCSPSSCVWRESPESCCRLAFPAQISHGRIRGVA